ncbi:MAG: hypothetical protein J3K34DRAFT_416976 [Monoraphidium minutum]|nr:MAG: hypothetical protein J3K34DRAFT_416976 [Monoraphidium minutum]
MRAPALLLLAALAASVALSAADLVGAYDSAAAPKVNAALKNLNAKTAALGAAKAAAFNAALTNGLPKVNAAAELAAHKPNVLASKYASASAAAAGKVNALLQPGANLVHPVMAKLAPKVESKIHNVSTGVAAAFEAVAGEPIVAGGNLVATAMNATIAATATGFNAKLVAALPFLSKLSAQADALLSRGQAAADAAKTPLTKAPSDAFFNFYAAPLIEGNPVRTLAKPIITSVDASLAAANAVWDGPLTTAMGPAREAAAKGLEKLAIHLEGPVTRGVAPVRASMRGAVERMTDFVEGPGLNLSAPIRNKINHMLQTAADFVEGNHTEYPVDPTPKVGHFVNDIGDVVGRVIVPNTGRVASAMFGIIPKPTPRNPNNPALPTDPVYPTALNPKGAPSGQCTPWAPPEGYKHVLDYCKAMQSKPKSFFADMWNKTSIPKNGDQFPVKGCVFGCLVGNDPYTRAQIEASVMFGWSGKCFGEERKNGVPTRFATTLNHDYLLPAGRTQEQRISAYTGAGDMIFTGQGSYNPKGFFDGLPAWHFQDDKPNVTSLTAGGWRTLHTLFQAWADGVVDEFRDLGSGAVIGKTFYTPPIFRNRMRADTNFFMLFQACTKDGKVPWRPEQREVPLIGDP